MLGVVAGALAITKSADVSSIAHGGTITYSFDVTYSLGDGASATGVSVTDGLTERTRTELGQRVRTYMPPETQSTSAGFGAPPASRIRR